MLGVRANNDSCYGTASIDKSLHGQRLFEKTKDEKRENILLDSRQPFMNRVGKFRFAHAERTRVQRVSHLTKLVSKAVSDI
jgi:hypothetical protein